MQRLFETLTSSFRKNNGILSFEAFDRIVRKSCDMKEDSATILLLLEASGYPIEEKLDGYYYKPIFTPYKEQEYCIVDIETNGSKPGRSQVIEIGAVKMKNGIITDRLETFVSCAYLPEQIINLTGIQPSDLVGAPSRKEALTKLRYFLGDAVFVAHNVNFDYTFLTASFKRFGLGSIGNPRLCTIDLARRTFKSERYGLAYLNESLGLNAANHHRAYSDALSASKIMLKSFETVPENIKTTDELILFSTSGRKERKKRKR